MVAEDERQAIRKAFSDAAHSYDGEARVQREIATYLSSLYASEEVPERILDAGCGTGHGGQLLAAKYPNTSIVSLDSAHAMCRRAPRNPVCADIEHLPFACASIDLYWSSLAWQWTDPAQAICEASRALKAGGILQVATLGPDTLSELREAFRSVDEAKHVRDFDDVERYEHLLAAHGFGLLQLWRHRHLSFSEDIPSLLRSIREIGAHTLGSGRRRGLLGRHAWQRFCSALESTRTSDGLPTTYDAIYLIAFRR